MADFGTDQSDNMEAINDYFMRIEATTSKATSIKDSWISWYNDLSWYAKSLDLATYDEARNRRNAFNLANADSDKARAQVKQVIKSGITTEEQQARANRLNSEGKFPETDKPLIPTQYKVVGVFAIVGSILIFAWQAPHALVDLLSPRRR